MGILIDADRILREYHRISDTLYTSPISTQSACYRRLTRRLARLQHIAARMQSWHRGRPDDPLFPT